MTSLLRFLPLLLAASLPAQFGFRAGDLFSYSPAVSGPGYVIQRIDPASGTITPLVQLHTAWTAQAVDAACYEPVRDRILVSAGLSNATPGLWAIDAFGNAQALGHSGIWLNHLAPRGDGIVYCTEIPGSLTEFRYLDAGNALHTLMDASGTAPFSGPQPARMIYHPAHNALFVAENAWYPAACSAGTFTGDIVNVHRLPLSANGTRVVGPATCRALDMSNSAMAATGWSILPDGDLLLAIDTNSNGGEPRLQRIDPVSLAASTFASTGPYPGAATVPAGIWSNTLGSAVVLDGSNQVLRAYGEGATGNGIVLAPNLPTTGSVQRLFEIGPAGSLGLLTGSPAAISLSSGGTHTLSFASGSAGGSSYWMLGSITGWNPGFDLGGIRVWANLDSYTFLTSTSPNTGLFGSTAGPLTPGATTTATVTLPPGLPSFLAGFQLTHCALVFDASFQPLYASNPVQVTLLP